MVEQSLVELTVCWADDDAESTLLVTRKQWEAIQAGGKFQKSARSYYEGEAFKVVWVFSGGNLTVLEPDEAIVRVDEIPVSDITVSAVPSRRKR